jgi:signal transduction histidine kinase
VDYRIARPDGAQRHVEAIGDVLPDEDGQVRVMLGVCQDITSRKKAELHWRRFANEIARRNQELDDFAYVVSHDLKAPLRGIVSMATWLLEDHREGLDADGQDLLEKICARTARMDALIEGILEYSRVGRGEGDLEEVASRTVVLESVELLGVPDRISVEVAPDLPTVTYNRTRLAQVFQNLIGNAIRYMGPDGGTVRVACEVEGGFYAFSVSDTGPGIEEQHHQRIFKIFQRLDPKAHSKATGVGLSIVKKCVELYGGQIRLKSRPGEGSRFTFTVPRRPSLRMTREFDIDAIEQTA